MSSYLQGKISPTWTNIMLSLVVECRKVEIHHKQTLVTLTNFNDVTITRKVKSVHVGFAAFEVWL